MIVIITFRVLVAVIVVFVFVLRVVLLLSPVFFSVSFFPLPSSPGLYSGLLSEPSSPSTVWR